MPKSLDKTKGAPKRKITPFNSTKNTDSNGNEIKPSSKKKKLQMKHVLEGIGISKQLEIELGKKKWTTCVRKNKNSEPRLCGNGMPMPSLADLEALYEDSDEDEISPSTSTDPCKVERCKTPDVSLPVTEEFPNSPTALQQLATKVIDLLSKSIVIAENDGPPPPVIPQKRPKKSGIPHIVGCKERKQVPWAPKTKFCVGSEKYGIDSDAGTDEDSDCPKKRKKRGTKINLSKSIFNAKSDEIAETLKENENLRQQGNDSPDSNGTVDYDISNTSPRCFSPIASTSKDRNTMHKNDVLYNKTLQIESLNTSLQTKANNMQDVIEVIEITDDIPYMIQPKIEPQNFDKDCCVIVEPKCLNDSSNMKTETPIVVDVYDSIDLTQTFDNDVSVVTEDEIEDLLAENQAILKNNARNESTSNVTTVDPVLLDVQTSNVTTVDPVMLDVQTCEETSQNEICVNQPKRISSTLQLCDREITFTQWEPQNEDADVVTNFMNHPQNMDATPSSSTNTVDLTGVQSSRISRMSTWLSSSVASFVNGHKCSKGRCKCDFVITGHNLAREGRSTEGQNFSNKSAISNTNQTTCNIDVSSQINNNNQQEKVKNSESPINPQSLRNFGDCPICMDSLTNNVVASTLCGHIFCMGCIRASIHTNGKKCPKCRKTLRGVGYHQVFL